MNEPVLIKNISFPESHVLVDLGEYKENQVISRTFAQNENLSLTLFAFEKGEVLTCLKKF